VDFVRYVQLVRRTMITVRGKRWYKGLRVTVKAQFVLGIWKVEVQAFLSLKPSALNAMISKNSRITVMARNKIRATKPFGAVHLTIRRLQRVSVDVKYLSLH